MPDTPAVINREMKQFIRELPEKPDGADMNSKGYPLRPGQVPCKHYLAHGNCDFGPSCRWHHPEDTDTVEPDSGTELNSKGYPLRPGQKACGYYLAKGECKYGASCVWDHPEDTEVSADELNSLGYPRRPSQRACKHYVATGVCNYAAKCVWHHPEPGEEGMHPMTKLSSMGYPVRPSQDMCYQYAQTGRCNHGSHCKWHHPEPVMFRDFKESCVRHFKLDIQTIEGMEFNSLGYPARHGQADCSFYLSKGYCSYGVGCKWNHPELDNFASFDIATPSVASPRSDDEQEPSDTADSAPGTESGGKGTGDQESSVAGRPIWHKYKVTSGDGGFWWWCDADGDYFLESAPGPWQRYTDPSSGDCYWWKDEKRWFWDKQGVFKAYQEG